MAEHTPTPVRRGTRCPCCTFHTGTFFARYHTGEAVYHCAGRMCDSFFIHSFPKPDFHSVKISTASDNRRPSPVTVVSTVVTPQWGEQNDEGESRFGDRAFLTREASNESNAAVGGYERMLVKGKEVASCTRESTFYQV